MMTRRQLVALPIAAAIPMSLGAQLAVAVPLPNPQIFQSGDLLWPKKPNAFVPYRAGVPASFLQDSTQWTAERDRFLSSKRARTSGLSEKQLQELRTMDFREFHGRYAADQKAGVPGVFGSGGGIYVGHVAILDVDADGQAWVIEALLATGVIRQPYAKWLAGRPGEVVWHGRLRDLGADARAKIADEARKHLGKPYDFWNFDLSDDSAFYCSKLVWLAIMRSQGFAVDGDPDPRRGVWFSPKQLMYCKPVARLHDPSPYAMQKEQRSAS